MEKKDKEREDYFSKVDFELPLLFHRWEVRMGMVYYYECSILFEDILSVRECPYEVFNDSPHKPKPSRCIILTAKEEIVVGSPFNEVYGFWCAYRHWRKSQKLLNMTFSKN